MKSLKLKDDVYWVGMQDPDLKVFDIVMETKYGTSYNSYLVKGSDKIAIFETVKLKFVDEYIDKLNEVIDPSSIDYIIVDHTEPDHAGSIEKLLSLAKNAKVVGSRQAIDFLKEIVNRTFESIVVKHGDTLSLGNKTLQFISAPFLHWPDSIYTYLVEDRILFTCDSFGSHYSFDGVLYSAIPENKIINYRKALQLYFRDIFSPFKKYMLDAIDKIKDLSIDMIGTGHGPVLDKDIKNVIETYRKWSVETNPDTKKKVVVPFVSAYGYTESLADEIIKGITENNDIIVKRYNLNLLNYNELKDEIVNEFYFADGILFGTSTINGDALPLIWDLAISLNPVLHSGKVASAFGSYGWSGEGVPNIVNRLKQVRMKVAESYRVKFKPSPLELENALEYGRKFAQFVRTGKVICE